MAACLQRSGPVSAADLGRPWWCAWVRRSWLPSGPGQICVEDAARSACT